MPYGENGRIDLLDEEDMSRIIIIGASHAGLACAERLRHHGFAGKITIFDREEGLPLQRPPLSKTYLKAAESASEEAYLLRKPDWFEVFDIDFQPDCEVIGIDRKAGVVKLADGRREDYAELVIAAGAIPRHLPIAGGNAKGVFVLRVAREARAIRAHMGDAKKAVVIGGGYIGLEAAASLTTAGIEVQIVEMAPRLLARVASPELSNYCAELHQHNGVKIHCGIGVDEILCNSDGHCSGVLLSDGRTLDADMVLAGIGVVPETTLAEQAGLAVRNGVLVSAQYQTDDAHIWSIGDVARAPDVSEARIESIHHAQFSASLAAAAITASEMPPREAWWFWSDQYDIKFQMAGLVPAASDKLVTITRKGRRENSLSVWSWLDGNLVAIEAANDGQAYMIGKKCLEAGRHPDPQNIANPEFSLKFLL